MSFKPEVKTFGDPKFYPNNLAFETHDEALASARDLHGRWTMAEEYRVVTSEQAVNYTYVEGQLVEVGSGVES